MSSSVLSSVRLMYHPMSADRATRDLSLVEQVIVSPDMLWVGLDVLNVVVFCIGGWFNVDMFVFFSIIFRGILLVLVSLDSERFSV